MLEVGETLAIPSNSQASESCIGICCCIGVCVVLVFVIKMRLICVD